MNYYLDKIKELSLDNKYTACYIRIISRAILRCKNKKESKLILGYAEKHHILPKSFKLGGEKDLENFAFLTAKEHFICHLLLKNMFTGKFKIKMNYALFNFYRISKRNSQLRLTSIRYEIIKKANSMATSERLRGKVSPLKGRKNVWKHTEESKQLISKSPRWNTGKKEEEELKIKRLNSLKKYREQHPNWADKWRAGAAKQEEKRLLKISKPVSINGKIYSSAKTAFRELNNIKYTTLIKRIESDNFPSYFWVQL